MSLEVANLPHYGYRKPPEWDGLVAHADSSIQHDLPYEEQRIAAQELWNEVSRMDCERAETNRYYGLGLVGCGLMQTYCFSPGQDHLSNEIARMIAREHDDYCRRWALDPGKGLYVSEVSSPGGFGFIYSKTPKAGLYGHMSIAERLVADSFTVVRPYKPPVQRTTATMDIEKALTQHPTFTALGINSMGSAALLMRLAIFRLHERKTGEKKSLEDPTFNPPLKQIASESDIAELDLVQAGAAAARIHLTELKRNKDKLLHVTSAGAVELDRSALPKRTDPVPLDKDRPLFHSTRLGCPVLYIAGAIPFIMEAMPKAVNEAQRRLLA